MNTDDFIEVESLADLIEWRLVEEMEEILEEIEREVCYESRNC